MMHREMDTAKNIYDEQMEMKAKQNKVGLHKNMPKVSGSLRWSTELRERISVPMSNFKHIEHP